MSLRGRPKGEYRSAQHEGTPVRRLPLAGFVSAIAALLALPAVADSSDYARPHRLVDIGGRRLNLYCSGSGSPTVVFDSGSGQAGWDWLLVHPQVAQRTRACIYDRAGLGFSDPSPRPGSSDTALDDLRALFKAADVKPPYLLVAHSYAAMHAQLFAYRHPAEVKGMVLVDGHHEDELARLDRITGDRMKGMVAQLEAIGSECRAAAKAGFVPGSPAATQCLGTPPVGAGRALAAAFRAQVMSTAYWDASAAEFANLYAASSGSLRRERRPFGGLPIICLTRGVSPYLIPGKPQSALNKAVERENEAMQREVCALSTRGSAPVIAAAGHSIHTDKPQAVVDAVDRVLAMARR